MIGIIDYGMGNLLSVFNAVEAVGGKAFLCIVPSFTYILLQVSALIRYQDFQLPLSHTPNQDLALLFFRLIPSPCIPLLFHSPH